MPPLLSASGFYFFFTGTATPDIYPLSLHDALPISLASQLASPTLPSNVVNRNALPGRHSIDDIGRSEEHTSELQSLRHLVCRLLLEKKKRHSNRSSAI